ncbi:DUF72 domain-containing protein [Tahibacter amnicola]|uniref:DUF72 domain-containing protein n=1 Tax=Tahibacter amnicola TaxID=2976241 RepID=A0ABY6B8Y2_9GAMM|nr:DUF72 domain-containing protein [Tahibacter amnicola]UXI66484.1 DUF72 domain-containing protein [Tahibacter amnicola]
MAQQRGRAYIGISGWRYAPWRGVFYPPGLVQREELAFAAATFSTIEINGTFYSLQRPDYFREWRQQTSAAFRFAVKAPRYITHIRRLRDIEKPLANFFASGVLALDDRLGPLLWQFPPSFAYDEARFSRFLDQLPRTTHEALALARRRETTRMRGRTALPRLPERPLRHAVEIRHESFRSAAFAQALRQRGVALVVADTAGRWPLIEEVTADFVYLRLHGDKALYESGYSAQALDWWATRIDAWRLGTQPDDARRIDTSPLSRRPRDVYCYFDNDVKVHAPFDAYDLSVRLGVAAGTPPRRQSDAADGETARTDWPWRRTSHATRPREARRPKSRG